jgi:hypothetical protein
LPNKPQIATIFPVGQILYLFLKTYDQKSINEYGGTLQIFNNKHLNIGNTISKNNKAIAISVYFIIYLPFPIEISAVISVITPSNTMKNITIRKIISKG